MKLPVDIYSPDSLSATLFELSTYVSNLRDAGVRAKNGAKPEPPAALAHVLDLLDTDPTNLEKLEKLSKDLEAHLLKAPVVRVTLAALPGNAMKRQITSWFRSQISSDVLLTFVARADIGGGIVVQAGSHVYDFSFKRLLVANKARLAEIANV